MFLPIQAIVNRLQVYWQLLTDNPLNFLIYLVIYALAILGALILHEISHGWAAYFCGDNTAKMMGRLSLKPSAHLDPIGTASMVLLGFGWAKPVPVNPRNFGNYRRDDLLVSLAGIAMNFLLFLLSTLLCVVLVRGVWIPEVIEQYGAYALLSPKEGYANSMIFYGISGNEGLILSTFLAILLRFFLLFSQINISLAVFNLLPLPPLDGFHVLNDTILGGRLSLNPQVFRICQIVLMLLCFTGLLSNLLSTVTTGIYDGILNLFLSIAGMK